MVVGIDEARQGDLAGEVDHLIGRRGQFRGGTDLPDDAVFGVQAGILQFAALAVHGDKDIGILRQQRGHVRAPCYFAELTVCVP